MFDISVRITSQTLATPIRPGSQKYNRSQRNDGTVRQPHRARAPYVQFFAALVRRSEVRDLVQDPTYIPECFTYASGEQQRG
jgi:hypothetical protein